MSTTLYKNSNTFDIKSARYRVVQIRREELAKFVKNRKEFLKKSFQAIADDSKGQLSHGTIFNIVHQRGTEIMESTLRGLADGLEVSFSELMRVAYGEQYQDSEEYKKSRFAEIARKFGQLTELQQYDLEIVLGMFEREIDILLKSNRLNTQRVEDIGIVNRRIGTTKQEPKTNKLR